MAISDYMAWNLFDISVFLFLNLQLCNVHFTTAAVLMSANVCVSTMGLFNTVYIAN